MRHIDRFPEPVVLQEKHDEWQRKFEEKKVGHTKARPDSSKYGHKDIRRVLDACSHEKCFYCESKLKGELKEIDHFIEVAIDPSLAYAWDNLYLACNNCNDKLSHDVISVTEVIDPCRDSDEEIRRHITFEDECICSQPGSSKGLKTIQKYKLDSMLLDLKRAKWLQRIWATIDSIRKNMVQTGRQLPTQDEQDSIRRYMQPDQPYSLMSEIYLKKRYSELLGDTM